MPFWAFIRWLTLIPANPWGTHRRKLPAKYMEIYGRSDIQACMKTAHDFPCTKHDSPKTTALATNGLSLFYIRGSQRPLAHPCRELPAVKWLNRSEGERMNMNEPKLNFNVPKFLCSQVNKKITSAPNSKSSSQTAKSSEVQSSTSRKLLVTVSPDGWNMVGPLGFPCEWEAFTGVWGSQQEHVPLPTKLVVSLSSFLF